MRVRKRNSRRSDSSRAFHVIGRLGKGAYISTLAFAVRRSSQVLASAVLWLLLFTALPVHSPALACCRCDALLFMAFQMAFPSERVGSLCAYGHAVPSTALCLERVSASAAFCSSPRFALLHLCAHRVRLAASLCLHSPLHRPIVSPDSRILSAEQRGICSMPSAAGRAHR